MMAIDGSKKKVEKKLMLYSDEKISYESVKLTLTMLGYT